MTASIEAKAPAYQPRFIDIGVNLTDPVFRGIYHGKQRHPDDLDAVIGRARDVGCQKFLVTGSDITSSRDALKIAGEYPGIVYTTAGIHPCSSSVFGNSGTSGTRDPSPVVPPEDPPVLDNEPSPENTEIALAELRKVLSESRPGLSALGEFGLDYDRLHYCPKALQLHSFAKQLELAASLEPQLPLFLHSRAAHRDFVASLQAAFGHRLEKLRKGAVVHSFTGTLGEARELVGLRLYIGINGCSLKTEENCAVVREIPLERMMLETDGPWCEVRPTHEGWKYLIVAAPQDEASNSMSTDGRKKTRIGTQPQQQQQQTRKSVPERFKMAKKEKWAKGSMVKGRNEPCTIEHVAKIVAGIKSVAVEEVCERAWHNTVKVFGLDCAVEAIAKD